MACDLAKNRRRVKWEYLNNENARCSAQFGFRLDGTMARQYWAEWREVQTNPDWTYLNDGIVLSDTFPLDPDSTGEFEFTLIPFIHTHSLRYFGSNEPILPPPFEETLRLTYSILRPVGIDPAVFQSSGQAVTPPNNQAWPLAQMVEITSTGLEPPVGAFDVTPLKACHNCVGHEPD